MQIIRRGAEAVLYKEKIDSQEVLVKDRIKKNYRISEIDEELRKQRTQKEAKLLSEARRCGVATPRVLAVDKNNCKILMEFIDGERLKELLNACDDKTRRKIALEIGNAVGTLHANNIVHGDLTTSNMILHDKIFFIDFGLGGFSQRTEDFATDLAVLKEAIKSTHYKYLKQLWQSFLQGYRQANKNANAVERQLEQIEKRGRYVKR